MGRSTIRGPKPDSGDTIRGRRASSPSLKPHFSPSMESSISSAAYFSHASLANPINNNEFSLNARNGCLTFVGTPNDRAGRRKSVILNAKKGRKDGEGALFGRDETTGVFFPEAVLLKEVR